MSKYEPIIGLEVHVELKTKSKMFCSCSADYFGKEPNTHNCPVCLGLPGALPVPNKQAIEWCIMIAKALNCNINLFSKFDRKNYFYPDLAKGFQLSQYDLPFGEHGYLEVNGKKIGITRVHMEEDTAKSTHTTGGTLIDFNRSGVPLVEIVTDPDIHDAATAKEYVKKLAQTIRYLGVSNADMEKGDMRLEPNISLRLVGQTGLPKYKVEVKNINSFTFVEKAIEYELKRHEELLDKGETPKQETRGYNEDKNITVSQRSKEEAHDYRYFPEPDIPPIIHTQSEVDESVKDMPELPDAKKARFVSSYKLSDYDAEILTREKETADYFEKAVKLDQNITPKTIANWMINRKLAVSPEELLAKIKEETSVATVDENQLQGWIDQVIQENPKAVADYKAGKEPVIMFLVGQVFKVAKMKLDPQLVKEALQKTLQ